MPSPSPYHTVDPSPSPYPIPDSTNSTFPPTPPSHDLDDIFSDSPILTGPEDTSIEITPDLTSLRNTHLTPGYLAGITATKPLHVQRGFDEGYELGGKAGLVLGWAVGVMEGLGAAGLESRVGGKGGVGVDVGIGGEMERVLGEVARFWDGGDAGGGGGKNMDEWIMEREEVRKLILGVVERAARADGGKSGVGAGGLDVLKSGVGVGVAVEEVVEVEEMEGEGSKEVLVVDGVVDEVGRNGEEKEEWRTGGGETVGVEALENLRL